MASKGLHCTVHFEFCLHWHKKSQYFYFSGLLKSDFNCTVNFAPLLCLWIKIKVTKQDLHCKERCHDFDTEKSLFTVHCKYNDCTQYSFWLCYMCHCNLAVHKASDDCAQSMAVLNLNCSQRKYLSWFFVFAHTTI